MTKTELEEDLRATFERAAASVPHAPDLTTRATTGVRRQQRRRTWVASGAAAAAVAVVTAVAFTLPGGEPESPTPAAGPASQQPSTASTTGAPSAQTVAGTWRPVKLSGFTTLKTARPEDPILTFNPDGTWIGSDGCNSISGTFTVGQRGEFTSKANGQRLIECGNVPHTTILQAAKRISREGATLRFLAGDGREVATYARTR